ncbi:hypothetical protein CC86DRAFT_407469 [Ophiobolus disseminans]|uniref:NACHT domain-containing protein n=1 Tax=Ophiobolus disseminans TaxID=1469910 RepID=A0A6A6ZWN2_9PLEO|nr:hypothetical protein CC86DRAFT_407469 [Ophiobolus disseminans]
MAGIRASLPFPTQPWEVAKAKFLEGLSLEQRSQFQSATIENLFYGTSVIQRRHAQESRVWPLQQRISSLVDAIDDYGKALDVYANTCGLILSPIWGSIRVLLHIAGEAGKFQDRLVDMLAQIGDVLPRFRIYGSIYRDHERLLVALSKGYLDILKFCVHVKEFFLNAKRSIIPLSIVLKAAWKPLRQDFEQHMLAFRKHSKQVEEEARLAHRIEAARMFEIQLANRALQLRNEKLATRHRILTALPSIDYLGKHSKLISLWHSGTNAWLQKTDQYSSWYSAPTSDCMCCYGIPGSGKSVLAATIVESLMSSQSYNSSIVCHYYCDYADFASLDPYNLVASLLKQALLCVSLERFTGGSTCLFDDGNALPTLEKLERYLLEILRDFSTVFVVLDGIDEIAQDNQLYVLDLVGKLIKQHPNLKVFLTSRIEEYWIRKAMATYWNIQLSQTYLKDDITLYVQDSLDEADIMSPLSNNPRLRKEVCEALVAGAQGMPLWVKFQLLELRQALTEPAIRHILRNLPRSLGETYARIISKTHQDPGGAMKIETMRSMFRWIAGAKRALRFDEIEEAIALDPSDKCLPMDRIARGAGERLIADCGNLVVYNAEDNTVSFAHHTVQQYLSTTLNDRHLSLLSAKYDRRSIDEHIGAICLTYLCYSDFETQLVKVPEQMNIQRETAEELLWRGVPFAPRIRQAMTWARSAKKTPPSSQDRRIHLTLPAYVRPSSSWTRKFCLLEYVVDNWVFHTENFTKSSFNWTKFQDVALHRKLLFHFRPWHDHRHQAKVVSELKKCQEHAAHVSSDDTRSLASKEPMLIYSWAMTEGVPSLLHLLSPKDLHPYPYRISQGHPDTATDFHVFYNLMLDGDLSCLENPGFWSGHLVHRAVCASSGAKMTTFDYDKLLVQCREEHNRWRKIASTSYERMYQDAILYAVKQEDAAMCQRLIDIEIKSYQQLLSILTDLVRGHEVKGFVIKQLLTVDFGSSPSLRSEHLQLELMFALARCMPTIQTIFETDAIVLPEMCKELRNILFSAILVYGNTVALAAVFSAFGGSSVPQPILAMSPWSNTKFRTDEIDRRLKALHAINRQFVVPRRLYPQQESPRKMQ